MEGNQIFDWIKDVIEGPGGMLDFEQREMAVRNYSDEITTAIWIVKCLANPRCKGSAEVLKAIMERRKEQGETKAAHLPVSADEFESILVEREKSALEVGRLNDELQNATGTAKTWQAEAVAQKRAVDKLIEALGDIEDRAKTGLDEEDRAGVRLALENIVSRIVHVQKELGITGV